MQPDDRGTYYITPDPRDVRWDVDARLLWRGAIAVVLVAVGTALVGLLVIRDLLDLHVLRRADGGELVQASTAWYLVVAAVAALVATGLLHLLLVTTPQPFRFFAWIGALAVIAVTLIPFSFDASRSSQIATAALHLVVGTVIVVLTAQMGRSAAVLVAGRRA
jgi:Family of unknown function (DUF6069)